MTVKQRLARTLVLAALTRGTRGGLLTVHEPDGTTHVLGEDDPRAPLNARLEIHDDACWPGLTRGSLGLGVTYRAGAWSSPDLVALIRLAARSIGALDELRTRIQPLLRPVQAEIF